MGRQEMRRKVYRPLLRAGLEVLPGEVPATALPMWAARAGIYDPAGTGRRDAFVAYDDPRRIERGNSGWHELATTYGLFDADRQFLLALPTYALSAEKLHARWNGDDAAPWKWHRVWLLDRWDIVGAGAALSLGLYAGYPLFQMLALDNSVSLCAESWGTGFSVVAFTRPAESPYVRNRIHEAAHRGAPSEWKDPHAVDQRRVEALARLSHNSGHSSYGYTSSPHTLNVIR